MKSLMKCVKMKKSDTIISQKLSTDFQYTLTFKGIKIKSINVKNTSFVNFFQKVFIVFEESSKFVKPFQKSFRKTRFLKKIKFIFFIECFQLQQNWLITF